jgi:hypothetical protein
MRDLHLVLHEEPPAVVFVEAVTDLLFLTLVDADDASANVIVDGLGLPGLPDHDDDAEAPVGGDLDDVCAEAVRPSFSLLGEEPA